MTRKYMRIFIHLLKLRLSREMIYSFNFFAALFVDGVLFVIQMLAFTTIFSQVDSVNGWSKFHVIIFIGTFTILDGIYMATYFFGVISLGDKIRNGELDIYITKPVNTLFLISFENMNIGSILISILGAIMVGYGALNLGIEITFIKILGYVFLLFIMYLLMYNLMVILRCCAFWFIKADNIYKLENELVNFCFKVPGIMYKGISKIIFYFILPYGLIATIPTEFLTGTMTVNGWIIAIGVCCIFSLLTWFLWKKGLGRYSSASS
jgi:ABC-2 type transport system permease protein